MRILILNEEFSPDTHGYLITDIAKALIDNSNIVHFFSAKSKKKNSKENQNYKNQIKNLSQIKLKRFWILRSFNNYKLIKILNSIIFSIQCLINGFFLKNIDLVLCASSHILFIGNVALILSKYHKARFIYRIEDIHPHPMDVNINLLFGRLIFNSFLFLEKLNYKYADKIVVLSSDMRKTIEARLGSNTKYIEVIPNLPRGLSEREKGFANRILPKQKNMFRMVFAGNIGNFQALEVIIDAMHYIETNRNIELVFIGDGSNIDSLKKRCRNLLNKNIFFLGYLDIYKVHDFIYTSDIGIVSLLNGIEKFAFPSKITTYLELNCPVLLIANEKSELAKIIYDFKAGVLSSSDDPKVLSRKIIDISGSKDLKNSMQNGISNIMKDYFSKEKILNWWIKNISL